MQFSPRNKLLILIFLIFLLPILAYAGWQYAAGQLEKNVKYQINLAAQYGSTLTCNQLIVRGFPFRMGIHCDNVAYDDNVRRFGMTAGALRTAAQIYATGHIIAELDGPMQLNGKGFAADINWNNLRASMHLDENQLLRFSSEASDVQIDLSVPTLDPIQNLMPQKIRADRIDAHARQVGKDLDLAGGLIGLLPADETGQSLTPQLQAELYVTVRDQSDMLFYSDPTRELTLRGSEMEIKALKLSAPSGAQIAIEGSISFTDSGLMNGNLSANITNLNDLIALIVFHQPQFKDQIERVRPFLSVFQNGGTNSTINLRLTIQNGLVYAGLFPLGRIPAI